MKNNKNKRKLNIKYLIIFLIIVLFIFTFQVTSSRYVEELQTTGSDLIAVPILTLTNSSTQTTISNMIPGDVKSFDFKVSNTDSGKINEVLLQYNLQVSLTNEIPLTATLFDVTSGSEVPVDFKSGTTTTNNISIGHGTEETKTYRLKLSWNANNNDYKYASKSVTCTVQLNGEQVIN